MKHFYLLLIVFIQGITLLAGNDITTQGARAAGMAGVAVCLTDGWSLHHNQGALPFAERSSFGAYFENRFLIPELGYGGGYAHLKTKAGDFGLSARTFGYQLYGENKLGLAYARAFGKQLGIGVQFNWEQIRQAELYGNRNAVTAEIGALYKFNEKLSLGAHAYNPTRTAFADYNNEKLPVILRFGVGYQINKKLLVSPEVEKNIYAKENLRLGIEYQLVEVLYLRTGISSEPQRNTVGVGIYTKNLRFDMAASFTRVLGFSPHFSLTYLLGSAS